MELWGGGFLAGVILLVGVGTGLAQAQGANWGHGPIWLWWVAYLVYIAAFLATFSAVQHPKWPIAGLTVTVISGGTVVALAPQSWTSVLVVMTTAFAAFVVGLRGTLIVGIINSSILFGSQLFLGVPLLEALLGTAMYVGLQALTAWTISLQLRELDSHRQLAAVHTELRATSALLAESSRSSERLRISRDLHDVIGHQLTALALELEVAAHKSAPPASGHVERARGLAKELLHDVRAAVGELRDRPGDVRDAITAVVEDLPDPKIHLDIDEITVDSERVATLVRCVQEITTNTIKHAEAWNLWFSLTTDDDGNIVLRARDDGKGAPAVELGNGLTGMRERVSHHGGSAIFSNESGFSIEVRLPLADAVPLPPTSPVGGTSFGTPPTDPPDANESSSNAHSRGTRDTDLPEPDMPGLHAPSSGTHTSQKASTTPERS